MTLPGKLSTLFPLFHLLLAGMGLVLSIMSGDPAWLFGGIAFLYLFPPLCFRLHDHFFPLEEGWSNLGKPTYSPWWTSLQFQGLFNAIPSLERLLRLIPGAYSQWLRLWGSEVGRDVIWTPHFEVSDRSMLCIGDDVVFGHRVALYPHVVDRMRNGDHLLYVKRIHVGDRAFIGAGSRIGLGAVIEADARLPILTDVGINQRMEK